MLSRLVAQPKTRPDVSFGRALLLAAILGFWMVVIAGRLVFLQVSRHEQLASRARQQQQNAVETNPTRGELLDRNGRQLARSVQTASVYMDPHGLSNEDLEQSATGLSPYIRVDQNELLTQFQAARENKRRFIWVARRIDAEVGYKIDELKLPGVGLRQESKREYPNGSLASHVLGFVGLDGTGLGGVEQSYNGKISGEPGKVFLERDAHGRPYESYEIAAKAGHAVVLTIDQSIQYQAEQALQEAINQSRAKSGSVIVLDPHNGEVLAMATAPTFDPNNVTASAPEARSNWALQNIYEPGSTFKIVAFSAAVDKYLAKPDDLIDCQMGEITVAGRVIHDHHPFGSLTISDALAKSSNVAAIKLGLRVGNDGMYDYITRYGFGARTGIELPGETPGIVRKVERWQPSSIGSVAMGQEVGVTPIQMVSAFGAIANDGVRVAPHLIREIRDSKGGVIFRPDPEHRRVVSPETAVAIRGMLEMVTLNGTAKRAQLDGYSAAGKTGTAQKIDPKTRAYSTTKFVGSFVGFAPASSPQVVIIVVIDEPSGAYHGGDVAAPIFRDIAERILPAMGVMPDIELKSAAPLIAQGSVSPESAARQLEGAFRRDEERKATFPTVVSNEERSGEVIYAAASNRAMVMPDFRGRSVRDVARTCRQLGLEVKARGEGKVFRQQPAPGSEVSTGQVVYVDFGRSQ